MAKGCFLINTGIELAPHDEEIATTVKQHREDVEEYLRGMVQKGQDKGIFSERQSALAFAQFICNSFTGLRAVSKSEVQPAVYEDIIEVTLAALK